jgi:hypothetical protein
MISGLLMVVLPLGIAEPPTCNLSLEIYLTEVEEHGSKEAYLCLATLDDAGPFLMEKAAQPSHSARTTRALTVNLLYKLDRALTGEEVRSLTAADLRLLRDGIYANRGRKSPSEEHDAIFSQFDWYQPSPMFTNGKLLEIDRTNLDIIDNPPPPPQPESASAAMEDVAAAPANTQRCGCATPTRSGAGLWAGLMGLLGLVRRQDAS